MGEGLHSSLPPRGRQVNYVRLNKNPNQKYFQNIGKHHRVFLTKHMTANFDKAARIIIKLDTYSVRALIDTGASCCLISRELYEKILEFKGKAKVLKEEKTVKMRALSASNQTLDMNIQLKLHFKIEYLAWTHTFYVCENLPVPVILGFNFLQHTKSIINMADRTITFPYDQKLICHFDELQRDEAQDVTSQLRFGDKLTVNQKYQLQQILGKFPDTITKKLGRTNLLTYKINVKPGHKVKCRPYQSSPIKTAELRRHVEKMLKSGIIRESMSDFASPGFCVPKGAKDTRFVVNYRALNQGLTLEATPMPTVESAFQYLSGAKFFTLLDLNSAYNQIPLEESSKKYTGFVTNFGHYEFNYLPFGLANGSMALTHLINKIFGDIKLRFLFAFFDDIVIYSQTFQEHQQHLECVLQRLKNAGLTVNPAKMIVGSDQIDFLGHKISNNSLSIDNEKTRPITEFPTPKNIKQLARFIGMTAYYARFIKGYAEIAAPLNLLKKKDVPFRWGIEQETAFQQLKSILTQTPVLKLPDFSKQFILHTDASRNALGAVLSQSYDDQLFPVAFASRATNKHEKAYDTLHLEMLGILYAFEKFRVYLEHREFQLYTDNSALTWLLNHPKKVGKIARWITTINSFQFTIAHVSGKNNSVADCLSRLFEGDGEEAEGGARTALADNNCTTTADRPGSMTACPAQTEQLTPQSIPRRAPPPATHTHHVNILFKLPEAFRDIGQHQLNDTEIAQIIKEVKAKKAPDAFSLSNGILVHKINNQTRPRVVIPRMLLPMLFKHYHEAPTAGHLGISKTLHRAQEYFWCQGLKAEITNMVKSCKVCQRSKPGRNTNIGNMMSEIPTRPFEKVFIDHQGPYPSSKRGHKYILAMVDAFTKYAVFVPARNTTATTTVRLLKTHLFAYFGFPRYLVTDNVPGLRSKEMSKMCAEFGITQINSSPYHPASNQVERVNQNIKSALRMYHGENHTEWDTMLHYFQIAYNSAVHESTKQSPASLFLGYNIRHPLELAWDLDQLLCTQSDQQTTQQRWSEALRNLQRAKQARAERYNQGRRPNPYAVGDWVTFRLHNQSSAKDKITAKLLPLYSEPCVISAFTSPSSVELVNPKTGKLVRKAHITQLKRYFNPQPAP